MVMIKIIMLRVVTINILLSVFIINILLRVVIIECWGLGARRDEGTLRPRQPTLSDSLLNIIIIVIIVVIVIIIIVMIIMTMKIKMMMTNAMLVFD